MNLKIIHKKTYPLSFNMRYIWQTPEGHKNIIIYFIVINFIGLIYMFWDKKKAQKGKWRIPENTLFLIAFLGGSIGTLVGMYKFRHKTKKMKFIIGFPTILILQMILLIYLLVTGFFVA